MCSRPSRSLNSTVTALMRFSSLKYLMRSSCTLCGATRSWRCFLAFKFNSSISSYGSAKKLRSSVDMSLLKLGCEQIRQRNQARKIHVHAVIKVPCCVSKRQLEEPQFIQRKNESRKSPFPIRFQGLQS